MRPPRIDAIRRVFLYARVSTVEQAERDLSLPAQLEAMRRYCTQRGYEVAAEFSEPGASGTDDNRKVFRRMLEDALAPSSSVQAIVVLHTSRFMRNAAKARTLKESLRRKGIRVLSVQQETADDPMGQLVEGIFENVDQYESEMNGLRTSSAMRENARQGYFNGSAAPYGFRVERIEIRPGVRRGKLVPNPDEVPTLCEVFRLCVEHRGAKAVARALNQRGQRYRNGKPWSKDLVLRALREEASVGTFRWGRRTTKRGVKADPEDWIAIPVEPVVDREVFDLAQRLLQERNVTTRTGRTSTSPLLLAGIARCGSCGASLQLETSGKRSADGEYPYRYYNCRNTLRTGKERCEGYRVRTEVLDGAVLRHVAPRLFTRERCALLAERVASRSEHAAREEARKREALGEERGQVEQRIVRWYDAFERGAATAEEGMARVRALQTRREEIDAELAALDAEEQRGDRSRADGLTEELRRLAEEEFLGGGALARHYLRRLIRHVIVRDGGVEIRTRFEAARPMMATSEVSPMMGRVLPR